MNNKNQDCILYVIDLFAKRLTSFKPNSIIINPMHIPAASLHQTKKFPKLMSKNTIDFVITVSYSYRLNVWRKLTNSYNFFSLKLITHFYLFFFIKKIFFDVSLTTVNCRVWHETSSSVGGKLTSSRDRSSESVASNF